jgi:hypothetical protein
MAARVVGAHRQWAATSPRRAFAIAAASSTTASRGRALPATTHAALDERAGRCRDRCSASVSAVAARAASGPRIQVNEPRLGLASGDARQRALKACEHVRERSGAQIE